MNLSRPMRRLAVVAAATVGLVGAVTPPAFASYDTCYSDARDGYPYSFHGFRMDVCLTVSQVAGGTWAYNARGLDFTGQNWELWRDCLVQLRLFHGPDATVQVRYHDVPCEEVRYDSSGDFRFTDTTFKPRSGYQYKAKLRIFGTYYNTPVAHEVSTPVVSGGDRNVPETAFLSPPSIVLPD